MSNKKKVLLFIDWFLPGTASGGPVRSITNMIENMGHIADFYIVTRDTDYVSNEPYPTVLYGKWNDLFENAKVYYLSEKDISLNAFELLIKSVEFDVFYINGIYSFKFSIMPLLALRKRKNRIIVGARGMLNPQAFSVKGRKKRFFLTVAKLLGLYENVIFHATNLDEAQNIKRTLGKNRQVVIAQNFPRCIESLALKSKIKVKGTVTLVNIARISKEKGTLYILKILSSIKEGDVTLDIFGPIYDSTYWEECLKIIAELPKNISVNYKGSVESSEIPKILSAYQYFVMPSEGENFGHSILEALTAGLPVLISNLTPWKNLIVKNVGWDISLAEEHQFINAIQQMIHMQQNEYNKWSKAAYEYSLKIINDPKSLKANKYMLFGNE